MSFTALTVAFNAKRTLNSVPLLCFLTVSGTLQILECNMKD